jgi:hypothetical protein
VRILDKRKSKSSISGTQPRQITKGIIIALYLLMDSMTSWYDNGGNNGSDRTRNQVLIRSQTAWISVDGPIGFSPEHDRRVQRENECANDHLITGLG